MTDKFYIEIVKLELSIHFYLQLASLHLLPRIEDWRHWTQHIKLQAKHLSPVFDLFYNFMLLNWIYLLVSVSL